jgi:hypothetical protein
MARYLRQLAEQAIRPPNALRSAAAAAFAPEPPAPADEADPVATPALATEPRTAEAWVLNPRSLPTVAVWPDSPSKSPDPRPAATAAITAASNPLAPVVDDHAPAAMTARAPAQPAVARSAAAISNRRAASVESGDRPAHGEQAARASSEPSSPPAGTTLTPAPRPARENQARLVATRARAEPAAAQPPDIHIHIGRIELTAAAPAAAAKRTAAPGARPMTLDAYLRQRGRKAP